MITADALRCQREHVTYLAERGARWILTVKGNQLHLHAQFAALPWRAVPDTTSGHGRRETRTLKGLAHGGARLQGGRLRGRVLRLGHTSLPQDGALVR
ncbi:hypothetical protein [Streptomyces mirabilis]|uniref:hypothetical protein n=1 Tax=Streptomyces mirabilis TaxID=68239 RepID=UPI0006CCBF17|nr:hypothetical protein OK006_9472 [Actinobacteria bacterium OK006]